MPARGEIWLFEPDPVVGREQSGVRPGVIISIDELNTGPQGLLVVIPVTTRQRPSASYPFHVYLDPERTGLAEPSYAMCEQVRSVAINRVYGRTPRGFVDHTILQQIEDRLRIILGL